VGGDEADSATAMEGNRVDNSNSKARLADGPESASKSASVGDAMSPLDQRANAATTAQGGAALAQVTAAAAAAAVLGIENNLATYQTLFLKCPAMCVVGWSVPKL
jgi:hypothetical protein